MTQVIMNEGFHNPKPSQKQTKYVAKKPDEQGYIHYTEDEHAVWHDLIVRQKKLVATRACQEYLDGIDILKMEENEIPQPLEINKRLMAATGWQVETVAALISFDRFFQLLAHRRFPAASFIRCREELDYLQEPDIFHEYFGHCPLLTNQYYADFTAKYGALALKAGSQYYKLFARLYWFTVEFGLINTSKGQLCYGGGILSSFEETVYASESDIPTRKPLELLDALRTPYRIDILQPIYFVIDSFKALYHTLDVDLIALMDEAKQLGEYPPQYATH